MRFLDNGDVVLSVEELTAIKTQIERDLLLANERKEWPGHTRFQSTKLMRMALAGSASHTTGLIFGLNPEDWFK